MNRAKAKGTAAETAAVRHAIAFGFPDAERIAMHGSADHGDVILSRDPKTIIECKHTGGTIHIPRWMREVDAETANAGALLGFLLVKTPGLGYRSVWRWLAVARLDAYWMLWPNRVQEPVSRGEAMGRYRSGDPGPWLVRERGTGDINAYATFDTILQAIKEQQQ